LIAAAPTRECCVSEGEKSKVGFVPQSVISTSDPCCTLHEWPVFLPRCGVGIYVAYFVEEVVVIWGVGRPAALVTGLLFRPFYWAARWAVVLPVQIIS
jgi:hypothetical protein